MPHVTIRFFGPARDLTGETGTTLSLSDGDTVGVAAGLLAEKYPRLGASLGLRLAVNRQYVPLDHPLADGDEIAVIPPVSGGAGGDRVKLSRDPIDAAVMASEMTRDEAGAVATFVGVVRAEEKDGRTLDALDYHAYEEMAMEQMHDIRRRAGEKFDILDCAVAHRLGLLRIGEASIAVVVTSAHRAAAFDACRWIVDAIKDDVPIWKQDVWVDGTKSWVEPQ